MSASQNGRTDVVELLIKHNANVNAREEVSLFVRTHDIYCTYMVVCI